MNEHITRYDRMPIPPVEAQTTWIDAGAVKIGVEYRLLTDAIAAADEVIAAAGATQEAAGYWAAASHRRRTRPRGCADAATTQRPIRGRAAAASKHQSNSGQSRKRA